MTRRLIAQIHSWIGLLLCAPLVLIGLTGSILVFEGELRAALAPARAEQGEARSVAAMLAAARAVAPVGYVPSSYFAPGAPGRLAAVRLSPAAGGGGPGAAVRVDVDPLSLAAYPNPPNDVLRKVSQLHTTLLLKNREGRWVVGWLGLVMLAMAVSGLVNWWPRRAGWRAAFRVSRQARGARLWRELHGAVGVWSLGVLTVVSFGGVYLAFPQAVRSLVDPVLPARDLRAAAAKIKVQPVEGAAALTVDEAIALAQSGVPEARLNAVFLPIKPDQPYRVALLRPGQERRETPIAVFVDPWMRRIVEAFDRRDFSAGETVLAAQHAMHAGQGFGPVWKLLVFLSGLLPALFAASGVAMWWLKRRRIAAGRLVVDRG